jgi:hypothetical protein
MILDFETNTPYFENDKKEKLLFPFGPPIFQTLINDEFFNDLIFEGKKLNEQNIFSKNLAGNLKYGNSYLYNEDFIKKWQPYILLKIESFFNLFIDNDNSIIVDQFLQIFNSNKKLYERGKFILDKLWINFQKNHDYNPAHIHTGDLSFVIYCQVPKKIFEVNTEGNVKKAGEIEFSFGETVSKLHRDTYTVKPFEKLMLIFPAKLKHFVPPFWVDEERISVSGNLTLINK